jgi:hypothetical protein
VSRIGEAEAYRQLERRAQASRTTGCYEPQDQLAAARGIVLGATIGGIFWIVAIVLVYWAVS